MQADCFAEYVRGVRENDTGTSTVDMACTTALISCVNAHLYGSVGEHLTERPGEADVTGKAFLEARLVVKVLERHDASVRAYADRARALKSAAPGAKDRGREDLERDLDGFIQAILQELQEHHPSD
jgi:hypothetical protein